MPLLNEGGAYPPGPAEARRITGTVDEGITYEADTQVVNSHTSPLHASATRRQFRPNYSSVTYTGYQAVATQRLTHSIVLYYCFLRRLHLEQQAGSSAAEVGMRLLLWWERRERVLLPVG